MTAEQRYIATIEDLLNLQLVCKACGGSSNHPIGRTRTHSLPVECQNCGEKWTVKGMWDHDAVEQLADLIRDIRKASKGRKFDVRFEIPIPTKST